MLRGILTDRRLRASVGTGLGRDALMLGRPPAGEGVEEWGCVGGVRRCSVTLSLQDPSLGVLASLAATGKKLLRSLSEREFGGDAAWGGGTEAKPQKKKRPSSIYRLREQSRCAW